MRTVDRIFLAVLTFAGLFIWLHDRTWLVSPGDSLPLLAALPLLVWLVAPWSFAHSDFKADRRSLAVAGVLFVAGLILGLNLLLALAWSATLWSWLGRRLDVPTRNRVSRLLPLAVLAFPWLTLDFPSLGWWYRLSGAWCAELIFQTLGFAVHRAGTQLSVAQMPFDVTAACSGIKALQAMLIAGTALCFLQVNGKHLFWIGLAFLPMVAWLANTMRVLVIVTATLSFGPEFAAGWFHYFSGWLVIVGTFGLVWLGLETLRRRLGTSNPT